MKAQAIRKGRVWALSTALLAGLAYSAISLTLSTKPAYASSCDCSEAGQDAEELCQVHGYGPLTGFTCPLESQGVTYFAWTCLNSGGTHYTSCTF